MGNTYASTYSLNTIHSKQVNPQNDVFEYLWLVKESTSIKHSAFICPGGVVFSPGS